MRTGTILALGRMAFGKNVTSKTDLTYVGDGTFYKKYIFWEGLKSDFFDGSYVNFATITIILKKFRFNSHKRDLMINLGYSKETDELLVKRV